MSQLCTIAPSWAVFPGQWDTRSHPGALPAAGQPSTHPGAPSRCFSGLMDPGGHRSGLCIHPTGCWTMLSAQGCPGRQCAAHPAYSRPTSALVRPPTTSEQSLGGGEGQESSNLPCSSSRKVLGQVEPNLHQGAGVSLWLHVHQVGACAGGVLEIQNKCLPFRCCCMSTLNGKLWLLCGAWAGSGLQLWQWEAEPSSPCPDQLSVEVSAGNCTSFSLIRHRS